MINYIRTDYAEIYLENGILIFNYFNIPNFDLKAAKKIVDDRISLQKEKAYPILCDMSAINYPNIEAKKYLAFEGSLLIKAVAYIVAMDIPNHLLDFFIEINPPRVPTKIFYQRDKAIEYLQHYK
ncbi:MAG: hypothetical protein ABGW76_14140 [Mesonia sp.]|uniref:DUF7793 family protein n=2 Tax=Mesonia TaxID=232115 RepID=UPI003242D0E4